jgi:hypothetical protein
LLGLKTGSGKARLGLWSSVIILLAGIGLLGGIVASSLLLPPALTTEWKGIEQYADAYRSTGGVITSLSFLPALVMCPAYVLQIVSIHGTSGRTAKGIRRLGIASAVVFAALAGLNYVVQLTVVRNGILTGETSGVERLVFQNPSSIMLELDIVGWFFLGLAFLSTVPLFGGKGLDGAIRYLLVANAVVDFILLGSLVVPDLGIGQVLLAVTTVILVCADVLLLVHFRRFSQTPA